MQINITNGTLTSIQETLSPSTNYSLPNSITVTGASSNYSSSTGNVTLTSLTSTITLAASGVLSGYTITINGIGYSVNIGDSLLVNLTGLYNSTTSTQVWTYSGTGKFLGFNTSSGQSTPSSNYEINDTFTASSDLTLYSVEKLPTVTYDLDNLNLSPGTYTITVKAKGEGYLDSDSSNSVTYTVVQQPWSGNDLTGTTWKIDSLTCSSGYGQFNITGTTQNSYEFYVLFIGYEEGDFGIPQVSANSVMYDLAPTYMQVNDIITITGGTDVTSSSLISWLESNATNLTPAPEPTGSILKIYSNDGRETSYDIYVDGVFAVNVPRTFTITTIVNFGSYSGATSINVGGTATVTLSSSSPYSLPETITVTNASYTYNSSTGVVVLSNPTGNVTITCNCVMHSGGMDG